MRKRMTNESEEKDERKRLTNVMVEKFTCGYFKPPSKYAGQQKSQDTLWDSECAGFGMRLSHKTGTRTYILLHRVRGTGKEVYITIGRHGDGWRLGSGDPQFDPRAKAQELKLKMRAGINPVEQQAQELAEKRAREAKDAALATTLKEVMEDYFLHRRTKHGPLRTATKDDIRRHVEGNMSEWQDQPIANITRDTALAKHVEITDRGAPSQANACMVYLRALCNHAREMHADKTTGAYTILAVNPVTLMFKRRKPNPEKPRTGRIPLDRIGAVWSMLRKRAVDAPREVDRAAADWISLVLLMGTRKTESGALRVSDIDLEAKTMHLRGEVADATDGFEGVKNHNDLILPLSETMAQILEARIAAIRGDYSGDAATQYLFASYGAKRPYVTDPRALFTTISKLAGRRISTHDLRRTYEDICKAVKVDPDERRLLFNHAASDVHGAAYSNNPDPEMLRPAVEAIAKYVTDAALVAESKNVLPFPSKKTG
ncbi:MAG: tyrosine-type recombinase/integrase [Sinobacteraceae bacterium]|nr:tyrosine-type recombinase/integrase [Nevskiaceae bacterium]